MAPSLTNELDHSEEIARLLFEHRMVAQNGVIGKEAFPVDELIEKNNKSVSVDRTSMMEMGWYILKLRTYEKPENGRAGWGMAIASVRQVADITTVEGLPVFSVCEDPITSFPPPPWDPAHAKIVRAKPEYTKGFVRGYRDKLVAAFQENCKKVA